MKFTLLGFVIGLTLGSWSFAQSEAPNSSDISDVVKAELPVCAIAHGGNGWYLYIGETKVNRPMPYSEVTNLIEHLREVKVCI